MQQVHRIPVGSDKVKSETWFEMASDMERVTRAAADPLNLLLTESANGTEAGHHSEGISQRIPETNVPDPNPDPQVLGLPDPDPLIRCTDPDPGPSISKQKK
jgi:hypothetical protein